MNKLHDWKETWIFLGSPPSEKHPKGLPPVAGFITCKICSAQAVQQGYGSKAKVYFRKSAYLEWNVKELNCEE